MNINVADYMDNTVLGEKEFEVGDTIYIPYKVAEINIKKAGNTVLKQFRLEGPNVNPNRETYTEHRLREVFEAV